MTVEYSGIIGYAVVVLQEVAVGLILGAMASFCVQIIMFAGKMIDMDTGLAMAQIMIRQLMCRLVFLVIFITIYFFCF